MFKKNHKFFFLMLMSLWALSKPVAKKNYCIKNQNRSSSRENYRKKIVHQCFALLIITLHRILFFFSLFLSSSSPPI